MNDGQIITYASGLGIGEYRGLKTNQHSGAIAGYRSFYIRFPDQRFSVILLSNAADMDADDLSHRIADLCLGNALLPSPKRTEAKKPRVFKGDPAIFKSYAGDYEFNPGEYVRISLSNDQLMAQGTGSGRVPIYPSSKTDFYLANANVTLTFVTSSEGGEAQRFVMKKNGREAVATRIKDDPLERFTGEFYSEELNVLYSVTLRGGKLFIRFPRGEKAMERILPDAFGMPFPIGVIQYIRGADGEYNGFKISNDRARNIRFEKVEIKLWNK